MARMDCRHVGSEPQVHSHQSSGNLRKSQIRWHADFLRRVRAARTSNAGNEIGQVAGRKNLREASPKKHKGHEKGSTLLCPLCFLWFRSRKICVYDPANRHRLVSAFAISDRFPARPAPMDSCRSSPFFMVRRPPRTGTEIDSNDRV